MNKARLKQAEKSFLKRYPGELTHPDMLAIGKKHKMDTLTQFARDSFSEEAFRDPKVALQSISKMVTSSSMVSMFEKPKFRDFTKSLKPADRTKLCSAMFEMLHGNQKEGFELYQDILATKKLNKWTLVTVVPCYFKPTKEVFIKPTTTKNVIRQFELEGLEYKPQPSWEFYAKYRKAIDEMKQNVHPSLSPNNAAFTGFLMMVTSVDKA